MITLDICIIIFLAFWSIRGFFKGFASEIISLTVWLTAIYLTLNFFYIPLNYIQLQYIKQIKNNKQSNSAPSIIKYQYVNIENSKYYLTYIYKYLF